MVFRFPFFDKVADASPHVLSNGNYSYRYIYETGELLRAPRGLEDESFIDLDGHFHDYWHVRAHAVLPTDVTPLMWEFD